MIFYGSNMILIMTLIVLIIIDKSYSLVPYNNLCMRTLNGNQKNINNTYENKNRSYCLHYRMSAIVANNPLDYSYMYKETFKGFLGHADCSYDIKVWCALIFNDPKLFLECENTLLKSYFSRDDSNTNQIKYVEIAKQLAGISNTNDDKDNIAKNDSDILTPHNVPLLKKIGPVDGVLQIYTNYLIRFSTESIDVNIDSPIDFCHKTCLAELKNLFKELNGKKSYNIITKKYKSLLPSSTNTEQDTEEDIEEDTEEDTKDKDTNLKKKNNKNKKTKSKKKITQVTNNLFSKSKKNPVNDTEEGGEYIKNGFADQYSIYLLTYDKFKIGGVEGLDAAIIWCNKLFNIVTETDHNTTAVPIIESVTK